MAYIKCGIVTKINVKKNKEKALEYINSLFNTELYDKEKNNYYIKEDVLRINIKDFRNELLSYSNFYGDSLSDCEAYCLETTIDTLMDKDIVLCDNNERYYFLGFDDYKFNTDSVMVTTSKFSVKFFIIPIFWDIYRIVSEDFTKITELVTNLIHKCLSNPLKDASFFTVI